MKYFAILGHKTISINKMVQFLQWIFLAITGLIYKSITQRYLAISRIFGFYIKKFKIMHESRAIFKK
jgi:hypothetical protein